VQVLGQGGQMLNDFDFDPEQFVPSLHPGQPGYTPELDGQTTTRDQRAQFFHKQFVFIVQPNSVLAMDATERKMMRVQLARMGYYDFWSLHETLETPNVGAPPALPLTPLSPPPADILSQMLAQVQNTPGALGAMSTGAMGLPQYTDPATQRTFTMDPASGQILEVRVPVTVTERLQAQSALGIGQTVNPAGRKASGQAPPSSETKNDEPGGRQTITESEK